jgi:ATP-binding cassette subfamily B protein
MWHYVRRHAVSHAIVFASVVAAVACATFSQYAIKHLVDVLSAGHIAAVWPAYGVLAALVAADNLCWRIGGWMATHGFITVTGDMRRDLFRHLTGHASSYFADRPAGTLASRITATANAIFQVENTASWSVLPPALGVTFSIALLGTISPAMAGALILSALFLGVLLARMAAAGRSLHRTYASTAAAVDGELVDVISNMSLVRAFGATLRERERFAERVDNEMNARGKSLRYLERLRQLHAATTALLTAGLLAWAIWLWLRHAASTGDVVLVTTLGFTILHGTRDLAVALVDTVQHIARLAEALSTLLLPHEMPEPDDAQDLHRARGDIQFRFVTYYYPGTLRPVLRNFSLHIEPGTKVGLVGRSGSGKTTVLALLQRLRDVPAGRILIDGQDVACLTDASLRAAMAVVPQDVSLFYRSVIDNIRYGRPEASDEEVRAAAEAAGCMDFIEAMPQGFYTMVGDRGLRVSGGQRQRLAIARAFLCDAPILLLDEATSALDSQSEQAVQQALTRLMQGRTVIAVAHRLSTLRDFDRIVVLQRGRIVQNGSPLALENTPGVFRELLLQQTMRLAERAA